MRIKRKPQSEIRVVMSIAIRGELKEMAKKAAMLEGISTSQYICDAIQKAIDKKHCTRRGGNE